MKNLRLGRRSINLYGLAVTLIAVGLGLAGFVTGSLLLINAFFAVVAIIIFTLLALGIRLLLLRVFPT